MQKEAGGIFDPALIGLLNQLILDRKIAHSTEQT